VDGSDRRTSVVLVARIMSGWKSLRTYLGACLPARVPSSLPTRHSSSPLLRLFTSGRPFVTHTGRHG
jgi:hypothetical protein